MSSVSIIVIRQQNRRTSGVSLTMTRRSDTSKLSRSCQFMNNFLKSRKSEPSDIEVKGLKFSKHG